MRISLIGMSGVGKSYWSKKLESIGFVRFCCDDLIEGKLYTELIPLGLSGLNDVGKWMGFPFDHQYMTNSRKYIELETSVVNEILEKASSLKNDINVVIDTTGSVIYTPKKTLKKLSQLTKVIYLEVPLSVKNDMYKTYFMDPRPLIWGDVFKKKESETDTDALARCYSILLKHRSQRYKKLASITMKYNQFRKLEFTTDAFINSMGK